MSNRNDTLCPHTTLFRSCKHHAIELGLFATLDKFEKASGGLGRIALAISADDDEQILLLTKLQNLIVRHIGEICRQPLGRRCFRKRTRKFSGVTSLTAIENGQAPCRGCSQCSWLLARAPRSGLQAREIATDPARLLSCERL